MIEQTRETHRHLHSEMRRVIDARYCHEASTVHHEQASRRAWRIELVASAKKSDTTCAGTPNSTRALMIKQIQDTQKPPLATARSHWRSLCCILRWSVRAKPCEENLRSLTPQVVCCWEHQHGNVLHYKKREHAVLLFILSRVQILGQRHENLKREKLQRFSINQGPQPTFT